ncbi:hypothetical protein SGHV004 [Glossina pallidipes salivary gland hypertrophy virus]|uniref:Uncharacterized protein n=1 Tax=Glossina hytrovirus (isolate Glossina pallidipes/Ethiopia/Seibersdorf/-) TaxID=379529 RepID=B0YLF9_GHVS|nr:hypothetical protein SGHV004 [Glossina pallidipes salivary gland hypertrophy virus]ABQ08778.1 hypothetical protein SGHV004 [Glossina pallidipes salivary gland hypertrophy virus]
MGHGLREQDLYLQKMNSSHRLTINTFIIHSFIHSFINYYLKAKLGFYTLDYIRGISVKTKDYLIGIKGQQPKICFYESDGANYCWGI